MDYTLAKKLKDAGFPQPVVGQGSQITQFGKGEYLKSPIDDSWAYAPTLSELIEACGKHDHFLLTFKEKEEKETNWQVVVGRKLPDNENNNNKYVAEAVGEGTTPEEATAKLFLALQESIKE